MFLVRNSAKFGRPRTLLETNNLVWPFCPQSGSSRHQNNVNMGETTVDQVTQAFVYNGQVISDRRLYFACKRIMDVLLVLLALIPAIPVILIVAVLIRLDSPGSILFRQKRIGLGGKSFTFYKFRTMRQNADPEIHRKYVESLIRNQVTDSTTSNGSQSRVLKLTNDPRITRVGRILRKTSLDELPQLINVLKGDMSLVGPRPDVPYAVSSYQEWHTERLATLPGITGWWQVHGRSRVTFDEMVRMDVTYIANQSLWLDVKILFMTIPAVVSTAGAL